MVSNLKPHQEDMAAAATYPGTSAEYERVFSVMNEIAWDKRNSLHVERVSTVMFLALNGPPLEKFDPLPHVRSWLETERGHYRKSTAWVSGPQSASNLDKHIIFIMKSYTKCNKSTSPGCDVVQFRSQITSVRELRSKRRASSCTVKEWMNNWNNNR